MPSARSADGAEGGQVIGSSRVPALENGLRILRLLASTGPLPAAAIAARLELPRSSVYHLLAVAENAGFILHLGDENRFGLGIAAAEFGSAYLRQGPLTRIARVQVARLVDQVGLSAHLAVLHGGDVLYVIEERARHAPWLVTDVDVRLPAHLTASGRAILAALPRAQVRALFPSADAFVQRPGSVQSIRTYAALRLVLDGVSRRGWAEERGDVTPGLSSIAVPILDHRSWPIAGLALTYRDAQQLDLEDLARRLRVVADDITRRLHGSSP
ncbi:MAG: IclR family transcriptional regulator [Micrococcales bacterium]|nr:IclR family transcriptional regulator [Micrococcales bacterium]